MVRREWLRPRHLDVAIREDDHDAAIAAEGHSQDRLGVGDREELLAGTSFVDAHLAGVSGDWRRMAGCHQHPLVIWGQGHPDVGQRIGGEGTLNLPGCHVHDPNRLVEAEAGQASAVGTPHQPRPPARPE